MTAPQSKTDHAQRYIALGWGLCSIPPGTKGPTEQGWNEAANVIKTPWQAMAAIGNRPHHGLGLVHASSSTCAIDVDHLEYFEACLAELGLDAAELFAGAPRIIGKPGRDKAIFRLPAGDFKTHKIVWPPKAPGEKPVTVFEMRAGAVQDVLPPSIHPDTHQPYQWREGCAPWDRPVPELPSPLLAIWRDWDTVKPQLMAACPWAPAESKPVPRPRVRSTTGENGNVIGQFNQAHDVIAILEAHGYAKRGKRWLAPTSSSGLAGVSVFEDRTHCYSHHASDPLNDGHAHDAFGLFCLLDHNGDVSEAIKDAARILGIAEQWPPAPLLAAESPSAEFMERSRKRKPANDPAPAEAVAVPVPEFIERVEAAGIPTELLRVPGLLGEVVELANKTAPYPQPILAVQTALALGSVVLGRRYVGAWMDNFTSLYFVNVAPSGGGKNHARDVIKSVLEASDLGDLIGPPGSTSSAAILSALLRKPCHIAIVDEFGDVLAAANAKGNFNKSGTLMTLKDLWGNLHGTHEGEQYSEMSLSKRDRDARSDDDRRVRNPAMTLLGMTTPDRFYSSLNEDAIKGGLLNRIIVAEAGGKRTVAKRGAQLVVPPSVIAWCKAARSPRGDGNLAAIESASMEPSLVRVDISAAACQAVEAHMQAIVDEQNRMDAEGDGLADLLSRSTEKALRVATILAASVNIERPVITAEGYKWAAAYIDWTTAKTVESARARMVAGAFAELRAAVLDLFAKSTAEGLASRDIAKRSRQWQQSEPRIRDQVLKALADEGHIALVEFPKPARGPARKAWVFEKFVGKFFSADNEAA